MKDLLKLLRPEQWLKNLFVLTPLFFSGQMTDVAHLVEATAAMVTFCLAASGIYCINDVMDAEADRKHPKKCRRPVAAGTVKTSTAVATGITLAVATLGIAWMTIGTRLSFILAGYMTLNAAYSLWLKRIALVDVFTISTGFVLRLMAGSIATGITLSHWIILMTFLLSLFLALAKRRDDVLIFEHGGGQMRRNVERYNRSFVDTAIAITVAVTLVCYIMYTLSTEVIERTGSSHLYLTSVFVMLGMFRYLQLTMVDARSGSPTRLLVFDRFLQLCIVGWIVCFTFILYL